MPRGIVIRRLRLAGLVPRDHPAPDDLAGRLAEAARRSLAAALASAAASWSGAAVLRIRRLEVDVSLLAAFDPDAFVELLSRAIMTELRRAEASGDMHGDRAVAYPSRAAYLAALVEALAAGRAMDCWWLRDAEGLRFLSRPAAIRTALLAEPETGVEALGSLPPLRLAGLLAALGEREAERVLDGLAAGAGAEPMEPCIAAVAEVADELGHPISSPLALYLRVQAVRPGLAGPALAAAARAWVQMAAAPAGAFPEGSAEPAAALAAEARFGTAAIANLPLHARRAVEENFARHRARSPATPAEEATPVFSRFGGLFLLWPTFPLAEIAAAVPEDVVPLIAHAALGLGAGRRHFRDWLGDLVWRELFGLDVQGTSARLLDRLAGIPETQWAALIPAGAALAGPADARFLILPRDLTGSRAAGRALAGLARLASARFARRLAGFAAASAPFLWENLLSSGAALLRDRGEWEAHLSRPPLDVLLAISRLAEGSVSFPSGRRVRITRAAA